MFKAQTPEVCSKMSENPMPKELRDSGSPSSEKGLNLENVGVLPLTVPKTSPAVQTMFPELS